MIIAQTAWMFSTFALGGLFCAMAVLAEFHRAGPGRAFIAAFWAPYFMLAVILLSFGVSASFWGLWTWHW